MIVSACTSLITLEDTGLDSNCAACGSQSRSVGGRRLIRKEARAETGKEGEWTGRSRVRR